MHEQPNPDKVLQTGLAFWASKTLLSAIETGLFARGMQHFESIRVSLGLHPRSARDFLDALVVLQRVTNAASLSIHSERCCRLLGVRLT